MAVLIGFAGSSGSGKTTLVNVVTELLKLAGVNVGVVDEVARLVFNELKDEYNWTSLEELRKNEKHYATYQLFILTRQAYLEAEALKQHDIVLTDRTLYDNLLYTLLYIKDQEFLSEYVDLFLEYKPSRRYNVIFLCEPVNADFNDGFRASIDIKTQKLQHELLRMLLPFYKELRGDFPTRVHEVVKAIRQLL